jgi:FlaA1/EpsC-like NDP-sugar epimerase
MTRRLDLTFTALLVPLDFFALLSAVLTAYGLRYSDFFTTTIRPILQQVRLTDHLGAIILLIFVWMTIFAMAGLYSIRPRRLWNEWGRIIVASTAGIMVVIASVFFRREVTASRFLVLATWAIAILYVSFARYLLRVIRRMMLKRSLGHQRLVIIGQGTQAEDLLNVYKTSPVFESFT